MHTHSLSRETLEETFAALPDEQKREYELRITRVVTEHGGPQLIGCLLDMLAEQVPDAAGDEAKRGRYAAFLAAATYYRRTKSYTQFADLVQRYGAGFEDRPLYPHVLALLYKGRGSPEDMRTALAYAEDALERLPGHEGVLHSFAETVVTLQESGIEVATETIRRARDAVSRAIRMSPTYAKYHCTSGRLLAIEGDYAGALTSLQRAIDLEEPNTVDYAIRLGDYQATLMQVQMRRFTAVLNGRVELATEQLDADRRDMREALDRLKRESLMMLGFFTAILSVTIGSVQLLAGQTFQDAAMLIMVLTGAMLVVYSGFSALFSEGRQGWGRIAAVASAGFVLIAAALRLPVAG
jgi:tetratricopeptide (TPR) repeat protein